MGQKVNTTGLRVGIIRDWDAKWYAEKDFATDLHEDLRIRKFIENKLANASVSTIEIERAAKRVNISIHIAKEFVIFEHNGSPFTDEQFAVFESRWFSADFTFNHKWSEHFFRSETEQEFRDEMSSYFSRLPDEIKHLPNDQRFTLNSELSVAFLHGTVNFPVPGVGSPHLRGTFHLAARRAGTGR